jgi:hypothetical protein
MDPEKILERYLLSHPDYWEFENEVREVRRLKAMCGKKDPCLNRPNLVRNQLLTLKKSI